MDWLRIGFLDVYESGEELADSGSRDLGVESRLLSPLAVLGSFRREFLGRLEVVVLYTQERENREQCLQMGCSPEQRI